MKTEEFDFNTESRVIPSDPVEMRGKRREDGRMVVLERSTATIKHTVFSTIYNYLQPGDLLVLNDSYILSNTLSFQYVNETVDVILYGHEPDGATIVRMEDRPRLRPGLTLTSIDDSQLTCTLLESQPDQLWKVEFESTERLMGALDQYGRRVDETIHLDSTYWRKAPEAYRSVYAKKPGSLDIPSAGLHFSKESLTHISDKGVELAYVTLHVGATEVLAVRHISAEEVENHNVRPEFFEVGAEAATQINRALTEERHIIAVGTTVMRTLESLAVHNEPKAPVRPQTAWTDLYIYPGFQFKIVDVLLTNLHRPRSSHIVLTAAFAGKDLVMRSYAEILEKGGYEFDMFGDSMLIL
ncbi:MAG: S-adenosylmethionine:tRNA ribosyltransferase-isomerase [Pseudonocardiaceae bacterium]